LQTSEFLELNSTKLVSSPLLLLFTNITRVVKFALRNSVAPLNSLVASKQVDAKLGRVENEVREMNKALLEAKEASAEAQDKEVRRNNIILYRVPENADGNDKRFVSSC